MSDELIPQKEVTIGALTKMEERGLNYGSFFPMDFLKQVAGPWGDEKRFPFFIIGVAEVLRHRGFVLTCNDLSGEGYRIPQQVENYHYAQRWRDNVDRNFDKAITLLTTMQTDQLTEIEKKRDENYVRLLRHERMLLHRSVDVIKVVRAKNRGLLKEN